MNYLKKNWGVFVLILIALIPVYSVIGMLNVDFSGESEQMISWQPMPPRPSSFPAGSEGEEIPQMGQQQVIPAPSEQAIEAEIPSPESSTQIEQGMPPRGPMKERTMLHMAVKLMGDWTIKFFVLILSFTPFALLTGLRAPFQVRQTTGILTFLMVLTHFLFFLYDEEFSNIFREIGLFVGFVAAIIMFALALTSNQYSVQKLQRRWKKLHQLAYLVAVLAVVHIILEHSGEWIIYTSILAIGFVVRFPFIKNRLMDYQMKKLKAKSA